MKSITPMILLIVCSSIVLAEDFESRDAKEAVKQYEKDLEKAREDFADALEKAGKKAIEREDLEEALRIKIAVEQLRSDKSPDANENILWKHKEGYFERLNDGYWIERGPTDVAHLFAQGPIKKDYTEITRTTGSKVIIRLYDDRCEFIRSGQPNYKLLYEGGWKPRE